MDRQQFCELLLLRKDELGVTHRDLTLQTRLNAPALSNIFHGKSNMYVESALKLANALGYTIVITNNKTLVKLSNRMSLTWWAQESLRTAQISVNKLADKLEMSWITVDANLQGHSKMRIDTLFKWAEITGYQVEVWQK